MSVFSRLFELEHFGIKLGLDNIRALTEALDHPERAYPVVLIAGTNGKGSVAAMVERALRAAGHRTGRYTSPHLVRLEERFALDGAPVRTAVLEPIVSDLLALEARCRADGRLQAPATFFEVTTACAFELFRRTPIDVAVVEVGLGGRFDATNVCEPIATAITSIGLDHTAQLGPTLSAVAFEKAGIAKPGVPLVVGDVPIEALTAIERVCDERGAPIIQAAEGVECLVAPEPGARLSLQVRTPTREYGPVTLALAGDHQAGNALVAIRVLEAIDAEGVHTDRAAVEAGLRDVEWPGRLELIRLPGGRTVLLDGAHNPSGAAALAAHLRQRWPMPVPLVLAISADKDAAGLVDALAPVVREIVVTSFPGTRAMPAVELAALARTRTTVPVSVVEPSAAALAEAWTRSADIVVAGSLFLVGDVRARALAGPSPQAAGES